MFEAIKEMLSFSFINRAIIVGTLVSLCAALLGVSLVLKRYSNIGDGLSHVGFGVTTVAVGLGATSTLPIAIPIVIIVAILLLKVGNNHKIKSDSAIAIISSSALAIGVAVTSVTSGLNTDVCNFMFGSILAMSISDVILSIAVSIMVLILFVVYYRKLFNQFMLRDDMKEKYNKTSLLLKESKTNINHIFEISYQTLTFLVNHKDEWQLENNEIQFKTDELMNQYNSLISSLKQ